MPNKDFGTMKTNIGNEIGDTSSSFSTRIGVYINQRMFDIIGRLKYHDLFESYRSFTASTTAGTRDYVTPYDFDTPVFAFNETTKRQLRIITEKEWIDTYFDTYNTTGEPLVIVIKSESNVRVQPSSSTTIRAVSTSATDTSQSMFVRGISGSAEFYKTWQLNGTSNSDSTDSFDYILQLGKSGSTTGIVTVSYVTGGGVAAVLSPESNESRYKKIGFQDIPSGDYDINIRYPRQIAPLVSENEIPVVDISDGIEIGAKADAWRTKRQFGFAADFDTLYERWIDRYIFERQSSVVNLMNVIPYPRDNYSQSFPGGYHI